jgi:hypothetical protein
MALTDESSGNGFYMPVAPAYGGGYGNQGGFFGGDWAWIILLLLIGGGGWGLGGFGMGGMMWPMMMGGMGGFGLDYLYPWLNNSQHISDGFRDQFLNTQIGDLRTDVNRGFGDVQLGIAGINQNLCQTGNAITGAVRDGFSAAEIAANGRQMASMQQVYGIQSQLAQCCCDNRAATQDLKYTLATEACATRAANGDNTQKILDKLCQLELDGIKGQLAQAQRENVGLQNQLNMAAMRESQTAQNAFISQGFANEVDALYNRLNTCPVPTTPVYGRTPIFTCPGSNVNTGCGCGGNNFGFAA